MSSLALAKETIDLAVGHQKARQYRVQSQYQHDGKVVVNHAGPDAKPQNLAISVKARLDYQDRFVGSEGTPQSIRYYRQSHADIEVDKGTTTSELAKQNRLIVTRMKSNSGNHFQIASVADMLAQHELDLLKNPADPLTFADLLNRRDLEIDDEWDVEHDALARFLAVDRVTQSTVKLKLKSVDGDLAKVYLMGKIKADVDDVQTAMNVTGAMQIDLTAGIVSGLRLNITEIRQPGQVAPGFEGQTKIDLQIAVADDIEQLSNDALREISQSRKIRTLLKWETESGNFSLQYDPSWKLITSADEAAILRYIENGDLMAQCNIVRLATRPADKPLLLNEFKAEVIKIVAADQSAQVIDAAEMRTTNGLKALQVTVSGVEDEVPLNWIYYNVASPDGRQVTFVFTLEEEVADRVETAAKKMVDGFAFNAIPAKSKLDERSKLKKDSLSKPLSHDAKKELLDRTR